MSDQTPPSVPPVSGPNPPFDPPAAAPPASAPTYGPPSPVPPYAQPGYAYPQQPYAYPQPAARPGGKPPVKTWDVVVTVILLVLLALLAMLVSFFGFFLVMASDPCGVRECSTELIGLGVILAVGLPWVALLVAVVLAIILLVRRKIAFWVPLAAGPLVIGAWFVGAYVAAAGVPTG